jgi:hypothetical protein
MHLYKKVRVFHSYRRGKEFDITILVPIQYWSLISAKLLCLVLGPPPDPHSEIVRASFPHNSIIQRQSLLICARTCRNLPTMKNWGRVSAHEDGKGP